MKLAEAMALANACQSRDGRAFQLQLACGFTPQHVQTFILAQLAKCLPERRVNVETGFHADLLRTLEIFQSRSADAAAVFIEWADLDARLGYRSAQPWKLSQLDDIVATASSQLGRFLAAITSLSNRTTVSVALPSLPLPPAFKTALAWADRVSLLLQDRISAFALQLSELSHVRVLSRERLDALSPPRARHNIESELRWGIPYTLEHTSILCELISQLLVPLPPKKGLITDLDDSLWRGLLGEDGVDAVSWDLDRGTHGHALYQRMLTSLADVGVLLAVATKNNPELVTQALSRRDLIVPADAFFPVEAGWGAKSQSVTRILEAWNIAPDSVVFIDDNPLEIAEVAAAFPGITALTFPTSNDAGIVSLLEQLRDLFGKASITEEDRRRLPSLRNAHAAGVFSGISDEVLSTVEAEITVSIDKPDQRAFDLVNKTNQFNLNGRRIDESAWRTRLADPRHFMLTVSYKDKFGPLGKVAVLAGSRKNREPVVDVWVMSCRAFSRRIEHQVLKSLYECLDTDTLQFDFVPTDRNAPLREFMQTAAGSSIESPVRIERNVFLSNCPPLFAKVILELAR
jgi:FkbH-like protein